jgi:very-short-patch-repair endonuclease
MDRALAEALRASDGVISRRDHPEFSNVIDVAARRGEIVRVLPSVYLARNVSRNWQALARAATAWNSDCAIVGEAAAALTFWRKRTPRTVTVAGPQARFRRPGLTFTRRVVPPELTVSRHGIRLASPNLTAIDLAPASSGYSIDDALRTRTASIAGMYSALELTAGRKGNTVRRRLLLDSRAEPWSSHERLAHRLLRGAGITRWHAKVPIICDGNLFYQDITMDDCPLVVEIDGKQHMDPSAFDYDRWRGNLLLLAGKQVLRFTASQLDDPVGFIEVVRRARARHGV